jgi:hypothetical protein
MLTMNTPTDALPRLAFSQAINPFKSSAGKAFLAKITKGAVATGEIGAKSLRRSY